MRVGVYRDSSQSANASSQPYVFPRRQPALIEEIGTKIREVVLAFENENYPSDDSSDANELVCDRLCDFANWLTWQAQAVRRQSRSWLEPVRW